MPFYASKSFLVNFAYNHFYRERDLNNILPCSANIPSIVLCPLKIGCTFIAPQWWLSSYNGWRRLGWELVEQSCWWTRLVIRWWRRRVRLNSISVKSEVLVMESLKDIRIFWSTLDVLNEYLLFLNIMACQITCSDSQHLINISPY